MKKTSFKIKISYPCPKMKITRIHFRLGLIMFISASLIVTFSLTIWQIEFKKGALRIFPEGAFAEFCLPLFNFVNHVTYFISVYAKMSTGILEVSCIQD
jgi:hypothetical protein